jgi:CheY-like chemotaxis protein
MWCIRRSHIQARAEREVARNLFRISRIGTSLALVMGVHRSGDRIAEWRLESNQNILSRFAMFKCQEDQIAVLGICIDPPTASARADELNYHAVQNGRRAIDMLRMVSFDVVLVGLKLPDMSAWDFLCHLKTAFPHQRWALVGGPVTEQQEVKARMFGCMTMFESTPSGSELMNLTQRTRDQALTNVLTGKLERSASGSRSQIRTAR